MTDFSLDLNEDQLQIQKWVHDFAEDVVRPAGPRVGRAGGVPVADRRGGRQDRPLRIDFMANAFSDPTGLTLPVVVEELFWGDAGIGLAIFGSALAAAGIAGNGTPEQVMRVGARSATAPPTRSKLGAFCVSEPDAGSDVSSLRTRAVYDEAKDEWVLNGTKAWITNGGIADVHVVVAAVDPELKGRGQASFIVPPGTQGPRRRARSTRSTASARRTPPRSCSTTCASRHAACSAARRSSTRKLARAREGGHTGAKQPAMATFEATRPLVGAQALGIARAAYEYALDYAKERKAFGRPIIMNQAIAFKLADMKMRDRRRPPARVARRVDGAQRQAVHARRRLDVQAQGRRGRGEGDRGGDPDPRRLRLRPRVPGRALAPRREDLHDLRRHVARSSSWSSPGRSPACASSSATDKAHSVAPKSARLISSVST